MKILVVSSWCPYPPVNGSKLRAFHLIRQLSRRHTIVLLTFAGPRDDPFAPPLATMCDRIEAVQGEPFLFGRKPDVSGLLSPWPRTLRQTYSSEMEGLVVRHAATTDLVLAMEVTAAVYLEHVAAKPGVFEDVELSVLRERATKGWGAERVRASLTWWKYARFIRELTAHVAGTTVVSDVEREHLRRLGCDVRKIAVIPNGVDRADLTVNPSPVADTLIYCGAPTYAANFNAVQYFLADVLPLIQHRCPNVVFRVTGDATGVPLDRLPARTGVFFLGHVPDVKNLVAHTRVSVAPLRIGGGTRLKILESMALGIPVVSTTKGAEGLAVTDGLDILIGNSPRTFADHVVRLLEDDELWHRLSKNGRSLVERDYLWEAIGARLDAFLRQSARPAAAAGGGAS